MAKMTDELGMKCFQIVAQVGAARSYYINAIQCAKEGKFRDTLNTPLFFLWRQAVNWTEAVFC